MVDFTKSYPNPVNVELLREELIVQFPVLTMQSDQCIVHNVQAQDEATIDTILSAHNGLSPSSEGQIRDARQGLKEKIALAHDPPIAAAIADLYNTILEQMRVNADLPTTYTAILASVNSATSAFQSRFANYVLVRTNIDLAATPHTDPQRRNICIMADTFVMLLVDLLQQ